MIQNQLILYRNFENAAILDAMEELLGGNGARLYEALNGLTELAALHGFEGNIWHAYLAHILANHENAFSTACEVCGQEILPVDGRSGSLRICGKSSAQACWIPRPHPLLPRRRRDGSPCSQRPRRTPWQA